MEILTAHIPCITAIQFKRQLLVLLFLQLPAFPRNTQETAINAKLYAPYGLKLNRHMSVIFKTGKKKKKVLILGG